MGVNVGPVMPTPSVGGEGDRVVYTRMQRWQVEAVEEEAGHVFRPLTCDYFVELPQEEEGPWQVCVCCLHHLIRLVWSIKLMVFPHLRCRLTIDFIRLSKSRHLAGQHTAANNLETISMTIRTKQ